MKSIMISIKPKWCELIANGKKTIEIRKTRPKIYTPFKCYIYCTKERNQFLWSGKKYRYVDDHSHNMFDKALNGKVIGDFVCDEIYTIDCDSTGFFYKGKKGYIKKELEYNSCLSEGDIFSYLFPNVGYGWHISELKIYDEPKKLTNFKVKDNYRIERCAARERVYNNPDFTNESLLKGSYYCNKYNDFCDKCLTKELTKPPQSWCYVDELR